MEMMNMEKKKKITDEDLEFVTGGYSQDDFFGDNEDSDDQGDNRDYIPVDEMMKMFS